MHRATTSFGFGAVTSMIIDAAAPTSSPTKPAMNTRSRSAAKPKTLVPTATAISSHEA